MSNKKIQILSILYPSGVAVEDICEVYETVLPKIQRLIDGVTIGYTNAEHVVEPVSLPDGTAEPDTPIDTIDLWSERKWEDNAPPEATADTTKEVNVLSPAAPDPAHVIVEISGEFCATVPEPTHIEVETMCDTGINPFVEDSKRTLNDEWKPSSIKNCTHFKKGNNLIIKGESSRLDTNWDYLCEFFDALPDETLVRTIPGLNVKKRTALAKFYESHPNFSCHIEKRNGSNSLVKDEAVLKKDEVRVHTQTNSTYESGAALASDFDGLTDD